MAIRKENAPSDGLIRPRRNSKEENRRKDYEAGIDPQDEQLNPVPEGEGRHRGQAKPGGGNRLHGDDAAEEPRPRKNK